MTFAALTTRTLALVACCAVLFAFGVGIWLGHRLTVDHIDAGLKAQADQHVKALQAEKERGDQATDSLNATLREQGRYSTDLIERQTHARLSVPQPRCLPLNGSQPGLDSASGDRHPDRGAAGPGLRLGTATGVGLFQDGAISPDGGAAADRGTGDHVALTLGAVSLWNSALLGTDTNAGACSPDAAATAACAAESGLTLDDAWRNHAANAASCAADRQRFQALIDYLRRTPQHLQGRTP